MLTLGRIQEAPFGISAHSLSLPDRILLKSSQAVHRRRWILRSSILLLVSAGLITFLVMKRRDDMAVRGLLRSLDKSVLALQAQVDALGQLPARLPETNTTLQIAYATDAQRAYAREADRPVIIATTPWLGRVTASEGAGVILYEHGKVWREWWTRPRLLGEWRAQEDRIRAFDRERREAVPVLP